MKAFVLAGGLGTRLQPRFGDLPKPLAPVGGRPFLERQLRWLAGQGVRDAVLCVGYGADRVREVIGDGGALGMRLCYSVEDEPLGTAGALRLARAEVDGPALVLNGDTLAPCSPWVLERARWERGAMGAVALFEVEDASSRGSVDIGTDGRVLRFVEKEKDSGAAGGGARTWANGGVYAFHPKVWSWIPPRGPASLERDVLPRLAAAGLLAGERVAGEFFDIGTPEEWERAERHFAA